MYMWVMACEYLRRPWIPLELKLQGVTSHLMWVPGLDPNPLEKRGMLLLAPEPSFQPHTVGLIGGF